MSTSSLPSSFFKVVELGPDNWHYWKCSVMTILCDRGLTEYIDGTFTKPGTENTSLLSDWVAKDGMAQCNGLLATGNHYLLHPQTHPTSGKKGMFIEHHIDWGRPGRAVDFPALRSDITVTTYYARLCVTAMCSGRSMCTSTAHENKLYEVYMVSFFHYKTSWIDLLFI